VLLTEEGFFHRRVRHPPSLYNKASLTLATAKFERAMIRERTSAGLAAARAEGRIGGRRKKLDDTKRREIAESVVSGRKSAADMARLYGVSQPTVSRIVAAHLADHA
jgi:DNA invertase Pin-like site-specific DNA recombinase